MISNPRRKRKKTDRIPIVDVDPADVEALLQRCADGKVPTAKDVQLIRDLYENLRHIRQLVAEKKVTMNQLLVMLFGVTTEKTKNVFDKKPDPPAETATSTEQKPEAPEPPAPKKPRKGHGRNGADKFSGAERVEVLHKTLVPGCRCPACKDGRLYPKPPQCIIRLVGRSPIHGKVFELAQLRCNLCGNRFVANGPPEMGSKKYDETVVAMVALLKYGSGTPFYRLAALQLALGIPLSKATQWDLVNAGAEAIEAALIELVRQAAQGDVFYNDDTTAKILRLDRTQAEPAKTKRGTRARTGVFTTGIVSTKESRQIAIFLTGEQHAGENLRDVLVQRASDLQAPIQMCDALSRNPAKAFVTLLASRVAHGRRKFVEIARLFDSECRYVLEQLRTPYRVDAEVREAGLSDADRLERHQRESGPVMQALFDWMKEKLDGKKVEPNSSLGKAIRYMQKHWVKLTLFLREPGAPLDNNLCERALKRAVLHRKNAYFYRTQHGADVGDLYMSLIHTTELNGGNPFDYLTALMRNPAAVTANPSAWMPWNYLESVTPAAQAS